MGAESRPIVVGVDGSKAAQAAARFAAEQARARDTSLLLVHALTWPFEGASGERELVDGLHSGAETLLRDVAASLTGILPAERIGWRVEQGDPVAALSADSSDAQALVVGGRGIGGMAGLIVGSTATGIVSAARCPVVVLPDDSSVLVSERRSVVVGVGGRGGEEDVLAFAFAEAAGRGTDLVAVHAWQDAALDTAIRSVSPLVDWAGIATDEERVLSEALAGWREKEPDVVVREVVVRDRTASALVAVSLTAQLLVVGRLPHSPLGRLGSATHGVLHRAGCPVAVVPVVASQTEVRA